ncbi:MAG: uracil-DNA glycosylase [Myxococcota bacterium]|jgi:DNA polymerase
MGDDCEEIRGELKRLARAMKAAVNFEAVNHAHGVLPVTANPQSVEMCAAKPAVVTLPAPSSPGVKTQGRAISPPAQVPLSLFEPARPVVAVDSTAVKQGKLDALRGEIGPACSRCILAKQGRTKVVFGTGNPAARLVFVGEAPGEDEDEQGEPFVGKAGKLLTKMIQAMGLERSDVYICNIVKCRPPGNRNPEWDEMKACGDFVKRQLEIIGPEVIVALGRISASYLMNDEKLAISRNRGRFTRFGGAKLMLTYHPAYLLRSPTQKRVVWDDLKLVLVELGLPIPEKKAAKEGE